MDFLREEAQFSLTHVGVSGPRATSLGQGEREREGGGDIAKQRDGVKYTITYSTALAKKDNNKLTYM